MIARAAQSSACELGETDIFGSASLTSVHFHHQEGTGPAARNATDALAL
jgi:hypothetical protein